MSYIPKDHLEKFYEKNENYRKYFIKKVQQYLLVDFTVLSLILTLSFTSLTVFSRVFIILLFLCAFSTKFSIITKKLKEFGIPFEEYWDKYYEIIEIVKARIEDQKERDIIIERELDEIYYATLKNATEKTGNYYTSAMHKLNRYISFSFFSVLIVLLDIGFLEFFSWNLICEIFVVPFDIVITIIFISSIIIGFDKFTKVKESFKNLESPLSGIKKSIGKK